MAAQIYVIASIVLSVIVVAIMYRSVDSIENPMRCPRCGAEMQDIGSGRGCVGIYYVVPRILVLTCPQCGYSERSWAASRSR